MKENNEKCELRILLPENLVEWYKKNPVKNKIFAQYSYNDTFYLPKENKNIIKKFLDPSKNSLRIRKFKNKKEVELILSCCEVICSKKNNNVLFKKEVWSHTHEKYPLAKDVSENFAQEIVCNLGFKKWFEIIKKKGRAIRFTFSKNDFLDLYCEEIFVPEYDLKFNSAEIELFAPNMEELELKIKDVKEKIKLINLSEDHLLKGSLPQYVVELAKKTI